MTAAAPFVEARGLCKSFPGVVALDEVDFHVRAGEVIGLIGKNGAGKSTLIKVLAGAVAPDVGEILLDGAPLQLSSPHDAQRAGLAFVHQELTDIPNLSVADNVVLGSGYPRRGPFVAQREVRRRALATLEQLGVRLAPDAPVRGLSAVNRRVVMIARALAQRARMLVLDEPTASLTHEEIGHLHAVIRALSSSGVAVVYVSHRLEEILSLTQRVVVMLEGRAVADRPIGDVDRRQLIELITGNAAPVAETIAHPRADALDGREIVLQAENLAAGGRLRGASLTARAGEVVGLAGLMGSGRSTLGRVVAGAQRPSGGRLFVGGRPLVARSPADAIRAGIIHIPEDRRAEGNLLDFSVRENITLSGLRAFRVARRVPIPSRRRERRVAADRIERLRIKVRDAETPARWLSGGNQQKVLLARWLDHDARVYVFDEPTQGIDVEAKEEVFGLIAGLAEAGKAILLISSDFSELVRVCHRVVVLREGEVAAELAGPAIRDDRIVQACYRGEGAATSEEREDAVE
jgi:ABC-type sugar transport system ATPase subunit